MKKNIFGTPHAVVRMSRVVIVLVLLSMSAGIAIGQGQQSTITEGYVQSLRSLYSKPDATSDTIGFIEPGEYVRLEHVNALVYRVFLRGQTQAAGYVVYPKIGPNSPANNVVTPIRATSGEIASPVSGDQKKATQDKIMWAHNFANIRLEPNTRSAVVAQLPPGTAVKVGEVSGQWTTVYKQNETVLEPARALGFVHSSLLKDSRPTQPNPILSASSGAGQQQANTTPPQGQAATNQSSTQPSNSSSATALVNVNTADQRMLETLPRIGPVLAKRIIEYRTTNGGFKKVEELVNVKGIGDKTLERLRPYVTTG